MALQRADGTLPGAGALIADAPKGSIAAGIDGFLHDWVIGQPVTARRAYERTIVLLLRDLAAHGPAPSDPCTAIDERRLARHLSWRHDLGLIDARELSRCAVHLARLAAWFDEHHGTAIGATRDSLAALAGTGSPTAKE